MVWRSARVVVSARQIAGKSCVSSRIAASSAALGAWGLSRFSRSYSASSRACSVRAASQARSSVRATSRFSGSTAAYCRRARSTS